MINGPTKPARIEFGECLRFHREQRRLSPRRVADMLGSSVSDVEAYEAGRLVPEGRAWDKYKGIVDRRLPAYSELRLRALAEYQAERRLITSSMENARMVTNGSNGHSKSGTPLAQNLGDKLRPAIASSAIPAPDARTVNPGQAVTYHNPPPIETAPRERVRPPGSTAGEQLGQDRGFAADGRRKLPDRPPGTMTSSAVEQRKEWTRLQFRARPRMPINGPDGLLVMMRQRFGVGIDPDVATKIKAEVLAELGKLPPAVPPGVPSTSPDWRDRHDPLKPTPEALAARGMPPVIVENKPREPEPGAVVNESDLRTAVDLVLGAIPGLRSFEIKVDEHGEATLEYTVREVKISERAGSLKVKR